MKISHYIPNDPSALNQQGEFERLFRVLRAAIEQLVTSRIGLEVLFIADEDAAPAHAGTAPGWVRSPYWSPVFTSVFHDAMLEAMFGPAATQHAEKGSYPLYFQRAFDRGLARPDARTNYFLHHVLLGRYLDFALPPYLARPATRMPRLVEGSLQDVPDLERYDLLSLSNVLDWSDARETARWADALQQRAKQGAIVLVRQLNNQRDLEAALGPDFALDDALSLSLLAMDKSLFYERVLAFRRVRGGAS
jgi:S-adenosylmethionine-diacylglycerol 3-amino-3-carboxypropyl transferase